MVKCKFAVSVELHADMICKIVDSLVGAAGFNVLRTQLQTYSSNFVAGQFVDIASLENSGFVFQADPSISCFNAPSFNQALSGLALHPIKRYDSCDLQRKIIHVKSNDIPKDRLVLKFEAVDTDELKGIEIVVDGDKAIYKVGEGETANYHIPNDKKLWET